MIISAINSNPALLDYLRSAAGQAKNLDPGQAKNSRDLESASDPASPDQKDAIVSEQLNDSSFLQAFNLRLQQNVPLYKSDNSTKTFNDSKKTSNIEILDAETGEPVEFTEIEETALQNQPGTGYYLNAQQLKKKNNFKQLDRAEAYLYSKIIKTYNLTNRQTTGTLVNLVY